MSNEYKPTYVDNTDNSISTMESTDTISFCKTGTKINTLSAKNVAHKKTGEDLNLCAFNNSNFNPVITINNNHSDCRIMTNLNVAGNVNINNNLIIPTHSETSNLLANIQGSIYYNTSENMYEGYSQTEGWQPLGGFSKTKDAVIHKNLNVIGNINLTNEGMIKTTGIGSFGSITTTGNSSFNSITTGSINTSSHINCQSITTNNQDINAGSGTITANTFSGNAATATKLATIVTIGGVNFDGSGSINLPGVNTTGNQNTTGSASTITGTISASNVTGLGNVSVNYATRAAVRDASGATLVDTNSTQSLSNKSFSDTYHKICTGNAGNGYSYLQFPTYDSSVGAGTGAIIQVDSSHCRWQSGSHWGSAYFSVRTNQASAAYSYLYFYTYGGGSWIRGYGNLSSSNSISNASDDRLKTDEKIITGEKGKEIIMKLRPQSYYKYGELNDTYTGPKLDTKKTYESGFIAQDIFFEIPEIRFILNGLTKDHKKLEEVNMDEIDFNKVQEDPDYSIFGEDIISICYEQIIPYLTAHNQEQQKEIDTLKTANQQQQTKIDTLETEISTLKTENTELKSIIDKLKTANSFEEFKNSL